MVSPHVQYFGKSQHYKQFVIGQVKAAFFGQSQCVTHCAEIHANIQHMWSTTAVRYV